MNGMRPLISRFKDQPTHLREVMAAFLMWLLLVGFFFLALKAVELLIF